ncbi:MAG: sugar transferase [Caulobacteraceae bacterium]
MSGVDFDRGFVRSSPSSPHAGGAVGRLGDILASLAMLLFLAPMLAAVMLAILLLEHGPLFASHPRIGRHGREFNCLRFRAASAPVSDSRLDAFLGRGQGGLREAPSLTPLGRFLRLSGLDEAPQFLNVLRGDMSIVGPAPISAADIARYGRRFGSYCSVRPGITGLWQLRGRGNPSFRRRVAMDVLYVRKRRASLDLAIILEAIPTAILRTEAQV